MRGTYAALDLGTNNCRLLIARPAGDGFIVIDAFSRIVRLGEGLAKSGRLSDAAMDHVLLIPRLRARLSLSQRCASAYSPKLISVWARLPWSPISRQRVVPS